MMHSRTPTRRLRLAAASVTSVVALTGLAACSESAGPERGEVTTEDLQSVEEDLGAMDERIGALEAEAEAGLGAEEEAGIWEDGESLVGQQGTVSAAVSEVVTMTDVGSAFRIAGESGESVAVISATPPASLEVDDLVQVSGTVVRIQRDTFEEDFGVAADDLFDDADAFFEEEEGNVAIAADQVEVMQEQAEE